MKSNELVWRTILDAAMAGQRKRESIAVAAFKAGVPVTTAHLACRKLYGVGAITKHSSGGFSTLSPDKVLTAASAWRNLSRDTITYTTVDALRSDANLHGDRLALRAPTQRYITLEERTSSQTLAGGSPTSMRTIR